MKKKVNNKNVKKLFLKKETLVVLNEIQAAKVIGRGNPINPDTLAQTSLLTAGCTG